MFVFLRLLELRLLMFVLSPTAGAATVDVCVSPTTGAATVDVCVVSDCWS